MTDWCDCPGALPGPRIRIPVYGPSYPPEFFWIIESAVVNRAKMTA